MKKLYVLLVDDDEDDCELFRYSCQESRLPCEIQALNDSRKVLSFLNEGSRLPDVVVLDMMMPAMNGLEVLRVLKKSPQLAQIPVVMYSSSANERTVEQAYEYGAVAFVKKPHDLDEYVEMATTIIHYWSQLLFPEKSRSSTDIDEVYSSISVEERLFSPRPGSAVV